MNHQDIIKLLDRYFAGETTLQEEKQLRTYFNQAEVHESLRMYQPMFRFFQQEQAQKLDAVFDERLLQKLEQAPPIRLKVRRLRVWLTSAAAILIVAFAAWWMYPQLVSLPAEPVAQAIDWSKYEPETPEEAYQVLKASLKTTSEELNQGANTAVQKVGNMKKMIEIIQ